MELFFFPPSYLPSLAGSKHCTAVDVRLSWKRMKNGPEKQRTVR